MKHHSTLVLLLLLSSLCFGNKKDTIEDNLTINLNQRVYNYVHEVKKRTDVFRLKLTFAAPVKGVSVTYTRDRGSDVPLSPLTPGKADELKGSRAEKDLVVMTLTSVIPGDTYTIKIKYLEPEERTIDVKVIVPARSFWAVSYGNNFIFNNSLSKSSHKDYFLKESGAGVYTISGKRGDNLTYAPSVTFTNLQYSKSTIGLLCGASLGLETNSVTPTVSIGGGAHFSYNVQVLGGFVMHQLPSLRPEYAVGDQVSTLLSFDQLTRNTYRGNLFVSLSFRFDKNPRE